MLQKLFICNIEVLKVFESIILQYILPFHYKIIYLKCNTSFRYIANFSKQIFNTLKTNKNYFCKINFITEITKF